MQDTLLLNADFAPLGVVHWQRAVCMLLDDKVRTVETYPGRVIRSVGNELDWPAVVHLVDHVRIKRRLGPSRAHVLARDGFTCQYCGLRPTKASGRPDTAALTIDHVVPRAQAVGGWVEVSWADGPVRVSSWDNLVAACAPCNHHKGARTPEQAGLVLRRTPRKPSARQAVAIGLARATVPQAWDPFLPATSAA